MPPCPLLLVSYKPLAQDQLFSHMADYGLDTTREGAGLNYCGLRKNARDLRRSLKKRDKKKPLQDNTPADVKTLLLVVGGFLLALFLVTKMALGL